MQADAGYKFQRQKSIGISENPDQCQLACAD
jgi:hypothetical protein